MKVYNLIVKVPDDKYGYVWQIDYTVESDVVRKGMVREEDGSTWDDIVKQAKRDHGDENVRVECVEVSDECRGDDAQLNVELAQKLDLNPHTVPVQGV